MPTEKLAEACYIPCGCSKVKFLAVADPDGLSPESLRLHIEPYFEV
jgi:hypothetical protein